MTQIVYGDRIGKTARISVGCAAAIFDESRTKVLLTRRSDNGLWCFPGGGMDAGESAAEACIREVWEETGLNVHVTRMIGCYTSPHQIVLYKDGSRIQYVSLLFEAVMDEGTLRISNETTAFGYFSEAESATLDVIEDQQTWIPDAFTEQTATFVR
ncbi:MAG: NUDIX domain-containing protein [Chloroflexota bacterium]